MAEYEIEIDGQTFEFEADSNEKAAQIVRGIKAKVSSSDFGVGDYAKSAVEGATLGVVGDEALAGARSMLGGMTYAEALEKERSQERAFQTQRPLGDTASEVAGGVGLGVGAYKGLKNTPLPKKLKAPATLIGKVLAGAGVGAGGAALYGAMDPSDGETRLEGATDVNGLLLGATLGGGANALGHGAGRLVEKARGSKAMRSMKEMDVDGDAAALVAEAVAQDGPNAIPNIAAAGPYAVLGNAGPSTMGLLDLAANAPGGGAAVARQNVDAMANRAGADMKTTLDDALGSPEYPSKAKRKLMQETSGDRQAAYSAFYDTPLDYSGDAGSKMMSLLKRVPPRILKEVNDAANIRGDMPQILAKIDGGSVTFETLPTPRQIDGIKRALQKRGMTGEANDLQMAMRGLSRDIVQTADEIDPRYKVARDMGADVIQQREAIDLGSSIIRMNRGQLDEAMQGMGPAQVERMKVGFRQSIDDTMAKTKRILSDGSDDLSAAREASTAIRTLTTRETQEKLAMLVGKDQADAMMRDISQQIAPLILKAAINQNSKTAVRQMFKELLDERVGKTFLESVQGNGVISQLFEAARAGAFDGGATVSDRQRQTLEQVARMITRSDIDPAQAAKSAQIAGGQLQRARIAGDTTSRSISALKYPALSSEGAQ